MRYVRGGILKITFKRPGFEPGNRVISELGRDFMEFAYRERCFLVHIK